MGREDGISGISRYIECRDCGFVLLAESTEEPEPRRMDECPDCGESEFRFVGE